MLLRLYTSGGRAQSDYDYYDIVMEDHIIDPEGEVIIIVRNPNAPFAVWKDESAQAEKPADSEESDEVLLVSDNDTDASNDEAANGSVGEDVRIQMSAKHLMLASRVFKSALTGKWKESSTFAGTGSVEITTENWDRVSLELAAKIALLADYYECNDLVGFIRDAWITCLREELPETYSRNLILWLWIAWYFNIPTKFKEATSIAMSESNDEIDPLELPTPARIIYEMNQKRQQALCKIVLGLQQKRQAFMT